MRVLWLQPDARWLEERRSKGLDRLDEVWDGVLHVVPPPSSTHQLFECELERALLRVVVSHDLNLVHQIGVFDSDKGEENYRVPDLTIVHTQHISKRGVEARAEVVVEILSPHDESREKFAFYAACNIPEYWIVDPDSRQIEIYVLRGSVYFRVLPTAEGIVRAPRLGLEFEVVEGPTLRITWTDGSAEI